MGCTPCGCDPMGSFNSSCHDDTGQCYCKPGVGGSRCDTCLSGYYGFSSGGCQRESNCFMNIYSIKDMASRIQDVSIITAYDTSRNWRKAVAFLPRYYQLIPRRKRKVPITYTNRDIPNFYTGGSAIMMRLR